MFLTMHLLSQIETVFNRQAKLCKHNFYCKTNVCAKLFRYFKNFLLLLVRYYVIIKSKTKK